MNKDNIIKFPIERSKDKLESNLKLVHKIICPVCDSSTFSFFIHHEDDNYQEIECSECLASFDLETTIEETFFS